MKPPAQAGPAIDRRSVLRGAMGAALAIAAAPTGAFGGRSGNALWLAPGYAADVLLRWGEPLRANVPALDVAAARAGQLLRLDPRVVAGQFGYNCDAVHCFPVPGAPGSSLLCVNHEYPNEELFLPGLDAALGRLPPDVVRQYLRRYPQVAALTQAMLGASVVLIERDRAGRWRHRPGSRWARRVTATTPMEFSGPARGHALLRTRSDPAGLRVNGTFANCAGGQTPWGTFLSAEENVDEYFGHVSSLRDADPRIQAAHRRMPPRESSLHGWEHVEPRFSLAAEPAELLRFGWVVEIDPFDPASMPRKLTALGRLKHECAACAPARDGRLAVYMGDDQRFEYVYKYLSRNPIAPSGGTANRGLLDEGTLHVARFDDDGRGEWLPLRHGEGPLTASNGFLDQGEVLIRTRAAADLLGATPMDRPEDLAPDPATGRVYVSLTKNPSRLGRPGRGEISGREVEMGTNAANPRGPNPYGHVIEIQEDDADCGATRFSWSIFLLGGSSESGAALAAPDNLALDADGRLWVVTDGIQPEGGPNGCYVIATEGPDRGSASRIMTAPIGAEVAGCEFTPDGRGLFLSIQHPGEGGTVSRPIGSWPDGPGRLARPSVVVLRREDGGAL